MRDICGGPNPIWVLVVIGAVYLAAIPIFALVLRRRRRPARSPVVGLVVGSFLALGVGTYWFVQSNRGFTGVEPAPDGIRLLYRWPKEPVLVPASDTGSIGIARGRSFSKSRRRADQLWLRVVGRTSYASCQATDAARVVAAGRELAALAGRPLQWQLRCPDPVNNLVASDEATVTASGRMEVPAACGAAGGR